MFSSEYLGYIHECEERALLDEIIAKVKQGNSIYSACLLSHVDPDSITDNDLVYIMERTREYGT